MTMNKHMLAAGFEMSQKLPQFEQFKKEYPDQINLIDRQTRMKLTDRDWFLFTCIQNAVNNCCQYIKDPDKDYWRVMDSLADTGDCEEFVFTKRALCKEAGYDLSALIPIICTTGRHETHMVLCLSTDKGEFIMDNIIPHIASVQAMVTRYKYEFKYMLIKHVWQGVFYHE